MTTESAPAISITVDHREAASGVPAALAMIANVELIWSQLDTGDYVASWLAIERKRCDDFGASIQDRRLFRQVERLLEQYPRVILLIEGPELYEASRLHPNAVRGALSYLAVLGGVTMLRSVDAADSAALIATMARHALYGLEYTPSLHRAPYTNDPNLQTLYLVEQLPGIGPTLAETLWAHFGTARALFNAAQTDLMAVPGIGPRRAAQIEAVLARNYPWNEDETVE